MHDTLYYNNIPFLRRMIRMKINTAVNDKVTNRVMVTYTGSKVMSTEMHHVTQTIIIIII